MVEVMRVPSDGETEQQASNRASFAEELGNDEMIIKHDITGIMYFVKINLL